MVGDTLNIMVGDIVVELPSLGLGESGSNPDYHILI